MKSLLGKKALKLITLALSLSIFAGQNALAEGIELGNPGYGGNGCPAGSASVTLSPDKSALTILFDEFLVQADRYKKIDRKSCNIAIPVHVPQGFSISVIRADYRGFVSLPRRAQARFSAEYFFAGQTGPKYQKTFTGPFDSDYLVGNDLGIQALVWSPCGADVNLRVNSSMMVRTLTDDAIATVDTADFKAGIVYQIRWKSCGQNPYNDFGYNDF